MDFTYPWMAARALALGLDPYRFLAQVKLTFFYPAPAGLIALPFAFLPVRFAASVFVGLGCGWLAIQLTREHWWPLALFASAPILQACSAAQWAPLLTAASLSAVSAGLTIAKPNLALPLLVYRWSRGESLRWAAIVAAILCFITFIISPAWPLNWLSVVRNNPASSQYRIPVLMLTGAPIALALLRWRRGDARLLFVLGCVPQNAFFYDQLPLLLIPKNRLELIAATLVSQAALYAASLNAPMASPEVWSRHFEPFMLVGMYLPALISVLRRPNETTVALSGRTSGTANETAL